MCQRGPGGQDSPERTKARLEVKWRSPGEDGRGRVASGAGEGQALSCMQMVLNKHGKGVL